VRGAWGLLAVLLATGCGSTVESQGSGESSSADTSRFEMVMTRTDKRGKMVITGLADYRRQKGVFRTAFGDGADPGESYNGNATPGDEVRIFGATAYAQWTVKKDKTYWVKQVEETSGYPDETISPFPGTTLDPKQAFQLIRAAESDSNNLGEEDVRGASTTHYWIQVDPKKLAEHLPAERKPDLEDPAQSEPFPVDVWVDDEDRVRRLRIRDEMAGGDSMTITTEFFDFGIEVDVERPSDDVISSERLDELTRPSDAEMRALCEEEIPEEECAQMEKESE
jgi:hypothetical protein